MEVSDFILGALPITLCELIAALIGTYFLKKGPKFKGTLIIVRLLWFTFFVEVIAAYTAVAYFTNYEFFSFVQGTPFTDNYWLYNLYLIVMISMYIYYFRIFVGNRSWRLFIMAALVIYAVSALLYLVYNPDIYFYGLSPFTTITGTLLVVVTVMLFYFELLRSELILKLKYFLPVYISAGCIIFFLTTTPVDLFSEYFSQENEFFVNLRVKVVMFASILMYTIYILGFLICLNKKKHS